MGSVVASELGAPGSDIPSFVAVADRRERSHGPGYLGTAFQPLYVHDANKGVENLKSTTDAAKTDDQNWETALQVWPEIVKFADAHGRRITFENCPMLFSYDEWPSGHNLATTPHNWRRILEQWAPTIGLNFDPSHLVLQMIDMPRFIREFGPHIYHFQAKDLMIDRDGLYEHGIFSKGIGWQIPRLPGLGEVDWGVLFSALYRAGYDGPCIIEHEDRGFEKTDELVKRGFLLARDILRPYCK